MGTDDGEMQGCVMMKPLERLRSFSENLHQQQQQQQQENKAAGFETYPFPDVDCTAIDSADLSCPPSPSDETDESGVAAGPGRDHTHLQPDGLIQENPQLGNLYGLSQVNW